MMRVKQCSSVLASLLFLSPASAAANQTTSISLLPGSWVYKGCWTDSGTRTLNAAGYADNTGMTQESCISYCSSKSFQWAGVEYSQECYCGSSPNTAATQAPETDCNMKCKGNANEICGAGNRISLFYSSAPQGPQPNPGVNGFNSIGCYSEGNGGRTLTYQIGSIPGAQMTVAKCTAACQAANYILAGVEYSGDCYCGNSFANGGAPATDGCNMVCNGNNTELCGGAGRLNAYSSASSSTSTSSTTTVVVPPSSSTTTSSTAVISSTSTTTTSTASPTPTGPVQPATLGNYVFYGCQTEATNARALNANSFAADTMTLEACASFCSAYTYWGVEWSRECYCGNSFNAGSVQAPATDCSMTCSGNKYEYCGNGNRLSVYVKKGTAVSSSSSAAGASSTSTTSTSASPTPTFAGLPAGWTYQGCYAEGANGRTLPYQAQDNKQLTVESCAQLCYSAGYNISGTEFGVQCFCGNALYNGGARASADSQCNSACGGNAQETCGGGQRLSIVSNGPPLAYAPPVPQTGGLGGWAYQGCYTDNINNQRTFFWQILDYQKNLTASMCVNRCASFGYMAAGMEYGQECYCGDPANIPVQGSTLRPDSECNIVCAGNASAICGGGSRLSTYFWTGTPFYNWTFPTGPAAGQYTFLIGGVTVPLFTMQSITGKVTFLSKWGTGPANETGAYELDLTKINDFSMAWRPLHLKTDVFCAAAVILPDKGGRQLSIGGWSGTSTFGVRLYWPDGSAGEWGTHDWQENANELELQVGRWYASAMVMANGSVLIIGGEVGSNSAAVPSLEILPYTGTAPVYMDWLDRTNPNNLYPFTCVLPSGGIFVQYYNEARIIDEKTFATLKVLPNTPAAVNDPTGGRTYPLEGTMVLLPQKYPYTDPLGVLICGGSTTGVANALDTCISTFPDVANPTWTIERMPSFRVMSCIAPLPDGTYLIANGAQHGVAGFGLGTNPNLNALLYDPSKPYGSRITVMANTTVARMYHSELITLLDGRVMVSGSDPEDGKNPQEYRVEAFIPPYLLTGKPRPTFTITNKDWAWGQAGISFTLGGLPVNGAIDVTLLGAVATTHGNSMGARVLKPNFSCSGTSCSVDAPPNRYIAPPGWYQLHVLDGGIPAVTGVFVRIGGDPAQIGNWPNYDDFTVPGV